MTPVPRALLLSDGTDDALAEAAEMLQLEVVTIHPAAQLPAALDAHPSARAIVVATDDPVVLRAIVERAAARRIPVILAGTNDVAYRRAIEFHVDDWYLAPASPMEIAWRIRSALARVAAHANGRPLHGEHPEYEQMLHDSLTGLPTLPVMIERSRNLFKERGELVVLYLNFVRYSKIEEIYGWEKLDAVLETTAAAVREFLDDTALGTSRVMVELHQRRRLHLLPRSGSRRRRGVGVARSPRWCARLQRHVGRRIEASTAKTSPRCSTSTSGARTSTTIRRSASSG